MPHYPKGADAGTGRMKPDAVKTRVDINITAETKARLDEILDAEWAEDRGGDRPERSKSEILEMILRKGIRAWKQLALVAE